MKSPGGGFPVCAKSIWLIEIRARVASANKRGNLMLTCGPQARLIVDINNLPDPGRSIW